MKEGISSDEEETQLERMLPNVGEGFEENDPVDLRNDVCDVSDTKGNITVEEAHCNILFDLTVLAEIVTYKSSVVGVSLSESFLINDFPRFSFVFLTQVCFLRRIMLLRIDNSIFFLKCISCTFLILRFCYYSVATHSFWNL